MMKTEMQIERDFYAFVKNSAIGKAITGTVYRSEMRPINAKAEDIVIKFLAGLDGQVQSGVVILNLYVPDITNGTNGRKVANKSRIGELQELLCECIENADDTQYLISTDGTPQTLYNEEIEQHFINTRIKFYCNNF